MHHEIGFMPHHAPPNDQTDQWKKDAEKAVLADDPDAQLKLLEQVAGYQRPPTYPDGVSKTDEGPKMKPTS